MSNKLKVPEGLRDFGNMLAQDFYEQIQVKWFADIIVKAMSFIILVVVAAECNNGQMWKVAFDLIAYFNGFFSAELKVQYHQVRLLCSDDIQEVRRTVIGGVDLETGFGKGNFQYFQHRQIGFLNNNSIHREGV